MQFNAKSRAGNSFELEGQPFASLIYVLRLYAATV